MLCMSPGSSELRTKLIKAARGFVEIDGKGDTVRRPLKPVEIANLFPELCSSHRKGSSAALFVAGESGRSTWYGFDACGIVI